MQKTFQKKTKNELCSHRARMPYFNPNLKIEGVGIKTGETCYIIAKNGNDINGRVSICNEAFYLANVFEQVSDYQLIGKVIFQDKIFNFTQIIK